MSRSHLEIPVDRIAARNGVRQGAVRTLALVAALGVNAALCGLLLASNTAGSRLLAARQTSRPLVAGCGMLPPVVVHPAPQDLAAVPHESAEDYGRAAAV